MNYTTKAHKTARFAITLAVLVSVIAGLIALNMSDIGIENAWDAEFPMANAHITWEQTFHAGHWE